MTALWPANKYKTWRVVEYIKLVVSECVDILLYIRIGCRLIEMAVFGELNTSDVNEIKDQHPKSSILLQNYPNPFNPSTTFRFNAPAGYANLTVHNLAGQRVASLVDDNVPAGEHAVVWDAGALTSGIYLARLQTADNVVTQKVVLQK